MIQRIQTLFLALAAILNGLIFTQPFAATSESVPGIFEDKLYTVQDHVILMILTIIGVLIGVIAIFMYKNRPLQIRMSYLGATLGIVLPLIALLIYMNHSPELGDTEVTDKAGIYLPILVIVFYVLASRFIQKDNKLVRSMDRLR